MVNGGSVMKSFMPAFASKFVTAISVAFFAGALPATAQDTTTVHFSNSCSASVQAAFDEAITFLHSFEYPETTRMFREIAEQDPGCAMAAWGSAMSLWHPLWAPPGEEQLNAGAVILTGVDDAPATPRERAYIDALKAFFSSTDTASNTTRVQAYKKMMAALYANNLDDPEAAVFYALALLASADPRDQNYTNQFTAAGILNWVKSTQPVHPGVLHYLIHSYDFPGLAHLALDSAETYARIAPDSAHAQHMPSHIFTRLGLWDKSLSSNHDSKRSADEYTVKANLAGHYDEGLHSIDYLMYALMQTARDGEAAKLLQTLAGISRTNTENFKVAYAYAASPARFALERRQWKEAQHLELIRNDFAWDDFGWALSIHHFARGIGAARAGAIAEATQELQIIAGLQKELPPSTLPYWREQVQVQYEMLKSWLELAGGEQAMALSGAKAAADREDAVDKHPVTPGEVLPARELYADMLFETGDYTEALVQYRTVLRNSPSRLNAMQGAARAAEKAGETAAATEFRRAIAHQTARGNRRRVSN